MQGGDRVHCLPRRRLVTPSGRLASSATPTSDLICAKNLSRRGARGASPLDTARVKTIERRRRPILRAAIDFNVESKNRKGEQC